MQLRRVFITVNACREFRVHILESKDKTTIALGETSSDPRCRSFVAHKNNALRSGAKCLCARVYIPCHIVTPGCARAIHSCETNVRFGHCPPAPRRHWPRRWTDPSGMSHCYGSPRTATPCDRLRVGSWPRPIEDTAHFRSAGECGTRGPVVATTPQQKSKSNSIYDLSEESFCPVMLVLALPVNQLTWYRIDLIR